MKIIFFAHPNFIASQSMPRYAVWLSDGMKSRGHEVEIWRPQPKYYKWKAPGTFKKWLGYIDQYIVFPKEIRAKIKQQSTDTLFVFTDHALGPWVPIVKKRRHVVHCHDFLAQYSALGKIPENPTGWTGRRYQAFIRNGYRQARNFISVSEQTKTDLHAFLDFTPMFSEVVYNGLTREFNPSNDIASLIKGLSQEINIDLGKGYILHVGGNQWYKNREGVIRIYNAWRNKYHGGLPLLMVGANPPEKLRQYRETSAFKQDIHFLTGISDAAVKNLYAGASAFLFPSLAEGFGWPIIEAMASGTVVITTGEAPMTEVGDDAAFYIKRCSKGGEEEWADESAVILQEVLSMPASDKQRLIARGIANAKKFDPVSALDKMEQLYKRLIEEKRS